MASLGPFRAAPGKAHVDLPTPAEKDLLSAQQGAIDLKAAYIHIWLNGTEVFQHEIQRGYNIDGESVDVKLVEGTNRLLLKISQHAGGWGFGLGVSESTF